MLLFPSHSSLSDIPPSHPMKPLIHTLLMTTKELDFRGLSFALGRGIGPALSSVLSAAPLCSVCILPGVEIPVTGLKLRRAITLQGSPGTVLRIFSPIDILGESQNAFACCEMTMESAEEGKKAIVRVRGCEFELRDCSLLSGRLEASRASVTVQSCRFGDNRRSIDAEDCSVQVERCSFTGFEDAAVCVRDCRQVYVESCCFERATGKGVYARFSDKQSPANLYVDSNSFEHLSSPSIVIEGQADSAIPANVTIRKNRVVNCDSDGVVLRRLTLAEAHVTGNSIEGVSGTACRLTQVQGHVTIDSNSCLQASHYGLYLLNSSACVENNQCFQNGCKGYAVGGILVAQERENAVVIAKNVVAGNQEFGVCALLDCGQLKVEGCHIATNFGHGVKVTSLSGEACTGQAVIRKCQIKSNRGYGILISHVKTSVEGTVLDLNDHPGVSCDSPDLVSLRRSLSTSMQRSAQPESACTLQ